MTQFPLYRHSGFQPEQPWFVLNAARHYSVIASDNPAISHFYSFEVAQNACMTLAIPDGCVDIVFDCDAQRPAARVCGTTLAGFPVLTVPMKVPGLPLGAQLIARPGREDQRSALAEKLEAYGLAVARLV